MGGKVERPPLLGARRAILELFRWSARLDSQCIVSFLTIVTQYDTTYEYLC